jgi:hypothetical protein
MFVLKRDPMFMYHQAPPQSFPASATKKSINDETPIPPPVNPLQTLLSLTDINYMFVKIATLLSIAWETIAYAWVTNLIKTPDQYHSYNHRYNQYRGQQQHQGNCQNYETQSKCQFKPISNVFVSSNRTSPDSNVQVNSKKQNNPVTTINCDSDSSWGQFVDVDSSNHVHVPRPRCFLR